MRQDIILVALYMFERLVSEACRRNSGFPHKHLYPPASTYINTPILNYIISHCVYQIASINIRIYIKYS